MLTGIAVMPTATHDFPGRLGDYGRRHFCNRADLCTHVRREKPVISRDADHQG